MFDHFFFILLLKYWQERQFNIYLVSKNDNILGDNDEEGTPVPIPNTAVKLFDAENT